MRVADRIVEILLQHGIDTAFGVPGESYLDVLDAIAGNNAFRFVTCRQEGGAAMAAEAHGKVTGRPGLCMVTRGPGATNAASGVHVAFQDSTPMILLVGQARRGHLGREGFQEVDLAAFFRPLAKWTVEIRDAARTIEIFSRAILVAQSGRPGPVVVSLPEDLLGESCDAVPALPPATAAAGPTQDALNAFGRLLRASRRPLIIGGGGGWTAEASRRLATFATAQQIPVAAAFRRQDILDNEYPLYVGHLALGTDPNLAAAVRDADLLIALGARLGEATTGGYALLEPPLLKAPLIHVHPDPDEIGTVFRPTLGIAAGVEPTLAALAGLATAGAEARSAWAAQLRGHYLAFRRPVTDRTPVQLSQVVDHLSRTLPAGTIVTNGAGNYAIWLHRFFAYRRFRTQIAPTSGSMGYGLPAAVAAAIAHPDRRVICFAGDGCFMMTCQELATAAANRLRILVIVVNNNAYGTIRMHQERDFPNRVSGTSLVNPDFVAFARSFGIAAARVTATAEFAATAQSMLAIDGPALIEIPMAIEAIRPGASLTTMAAAPA
jgi:acetolactate synthase-1/2/3 large subunit